ncbi:MAG: S9 family peptidase [Acidobacteria bacterium]|nr:S9 family peptidase [Acidobacteriota bacterium]
MTKSLTRVCAFLAILSVLSVSGWAAKKTLTPELVTSEQQIVPLAISRVRWRPGSEQISYIRHRDEDDSLWIYDVATRQKRRVDVSSTAGVDLDSYRWSPKGDRILFEGGGNLWLFDLASGKTRRLTGGAQKAEEPTFSPTGDRVAFVRQNNLFTLSLQTGKITQLTSDGTPLILNGKLDWVYKEELADRATGRAYEWSPNGKEIAYLRLNDTPVPEYPLVHFLSTHVKFSLQRFPQPGDPNPHATFHVVSVSTRERHDWVPPRNSLPIEYFGPSFSWTPDSKAIAFLTLNRDQTEMAVHLWNADSGSNRVLLVEKDPYWINSLYPPGFLGDGRFLWLSERDGWLHLYLYSRQGTLLRKLTSGNWMLDHPLFSSLPMFQYGGDSGWVYFLSTKPDPRQRQIYRVRLDGSHFERLSKEPGTHTLLLSPDGRFYVETFSDYKTPPITRLFKSDGAFVATLDKPENHLHDYALGQTEFVTVTAPDGTKLYARLVKPPDFDPHKKYPVIVNVYGGPEVQIVQDAWGVTSLQDQLFAEHGFLLWSLDNRGSWGRGHAWETTIFEHLGRQELSDQMAGVNYLKSLPYVDSNRMGIWGWSYGGFMTLYTLTHAPRVFKCGAAGGPVTDWRFYDSIYTERYMRTPKVNPEGYQESSPLDAAGNLRAKLLLMHGVDDDNVHLQNTINFIEALIRDGKSYQLYLQPGEKHGFVGYSARLYLVDRLLKFFEDNLQPESK